MKISAKTDYACKAILELSAHWPNTEPLQLNVIAERQNIPIKFLNQIFIDLKRLGYVTSTRGKKGGYLLLKKPKDISLLQMFESFENFSIEESKVSGAIIQNIFSELTLKFSNILKDINFADISDRKRDTDNVVMFEI